MTFGSPASTCSNCSTRSSTSPRSRRAAWTWSRALSSVRDALEYGVSLVRERAASHGVTVTVEISAGVDAVEADELRFKQVILNLLSNAVKFTGDGGRVDMRAATDGAELTVTVTDNGPGVAPEDRQRIFESFQQGGRGASKAEGTGLGLTLSKRIVELHGGRIWVESEVGVGSTFGFTVPLVAAGRDRRGAEVPTEPVAPSDLPTIVVVEDDRRSLDLITLYLEDAGVEVVTARDGQEGLEAVRRVHPAAVVLDLRLPKLDGWDLLALLKADPATAAIPVVVVSMVDERGKGFALGAAEYLVKPVGRDEVRAAVARVTGRARHRDNGRRHRRRPAGARARSGRARTRRLDRRASRERSGRRRARPDSTPSRRARRSDDARDGRFRRRGGAAQRSGDGRRCRSSCSPRSR